MCNQLIRYNSSTSINFWVVEDKDLAKKLGIDVSKPGDIYSIKPTDTPFRSITATKKNRISIMDYFYTSEKILTSVQARDGYRPLEKAVMTTWMSFPQICRNENELMTIFRNLYGEKVLLVHCDPATHGKETYDRVLDTFIKAQHEYNRKSG